MSSISDNKNAAATPAFASADLADLLRPSAPGSTSTNQASELLSLLGIAGAEGVSDVREATGAKSKGVLARKLASLGAPPVPNAGKATEQSAKAFESMNVDINKAMLALTMPPLPSAAKAAAAQDLQAQTPASAPAAAPPADRRAPPQSGSRQAGEAPSGLSAQRRSASPSASILHSRAQSSSPTAQAAAPQTSTAAAAPPVDAAELATLQTLPGLEGLTTEGASEKVGQVLQGAMDGIKKGSADALYAFMVLRVLFGNDAVKALGQISDISANLQETAADQQLAKARVAAEQQEKAANKAAKFGALSKIVTVVMMVATVVAAVCTLGAAAPGMAILLGCVLAAGMAAGFIGGGVAAGKKEGKGFDIWKGLDMASTVGDAILMAIGIGAIMMALKNAGKAVMNGTVKKAAAEAVGRAAKDATKAGVAKAGAAAAEQQAKTYSMRMMKEFIKKFGETVVKESKDAYKSILRASEKKAAPTVAKGAATAGTDASAASLSQVSKDLVDPLLQAGFNTRALYMAQGGLAATQTATQMTQAVGAFQVTQLQADAHENEAFSKLWESIYSQAKQMYTQSQESMQNFVDMHNHEVESIMQMFNNQTKTTGLIARNT